MKKYTKRFLAFVLAAAMVVTGVPMSAKEVKAAEPESFVLYLAKGTSGAHSNLTDTVGEIVDAKEGASVTYSLTTSYAGENWSINPDRTTAPLQEAYPDRYVNAGTSSGNNVNGMHVFKWNTNAGYSGARKVLYWNYGNTIGIDFTVAKAGKYLVETVFYDYSAVNATYIFNAGTENEATLLKATGRINNDKATATKVGGSVYLTEGVNTLDMITLSDGYQASNVVAIIFTEVGYGQATMNLENDAAYFVGDTLELATSAALTDGTDVSSDVTVTYASSNPGVASVEGNVLSFVGGGEATITAEVYYGGEYKETLSANVKSTNAIALKLGEPIQGALFDDGTIGGMDVTTSGSSLTPALTTSLAGTNWTINADRTLPSVVEGTNYYPKRVRQDITNEDGSVTPAAAGMDYMRWGSSSSNWTKNRRSVIMFAKDTTLAFDFNSATAGLYTVDVVYYDDNCKPFSVKVNDTVFENALEGTLQTSVEPTGETKKDIIVRQNGIVQLAEGANTVDFISTSTSYKYGSSILGVIFTQFFPEEYGSASFAVADAEYSVDSEPITLSTTAVDVNGADIASLINVEYTSSNPNVAAVEGNVLSFVDGGVATINADVYYCGEYKETLTATVKVSDSFKLDFGAPTTGARFETTDAETGEVVVTYGALDVTTMSKTQPSYAPYLTNSLAGENWRLNADRTVPSVVDGTDYYPKRQAKNVLAEDGVTIVTPAAAGMDYMRWGNSKSDWSGHARSLIFFARGTKLAFDFDVTADVAGAYILDVVYYGDSDPKDFNVQVNNKLYENVLTGTVMNGVAQTGDVKDEVVVRQSGAVYLTEGVNTIDVIATSTSFSGESGILGVEFTRCFPADLASASFALDAEYEYGAEPVALTTTAVDVNGADVTADTVVTYTSSNENVAVVEDGALTFVGAGTATITASVAYFGTVTEVSADIKVVVPGTLVLDMDQVDPASLVHVTDEKGTTRYYVGPETKSYDTANLAWNVNAELSDIEMLNANYVRAWYDAKKDVTSYIKLMGEIGEWAMDFEVAEAGSYDVFANVFTEEKGGYTKVWVNGNYVGILDAALGNPTNQPLLTADLLAGKNTITFSVYTRSSGTNDYFALESVEFVPTIGEAKVVTDFAAELDITEYDMINVDEEGNVLRGQITTNIATTGGVLVLPEIFTPELEVPVVYYNKSGVVTPANAGEATITVSVPGKDPVEFTVTVADSRPRYTVTWLNADGTELEVDPDLLAGAAVSYDGETPVLAADAQYTYEFAGWVDAEGNAPIEAVVDADLTYTADYTKTVNKYTVKFVVNGEVVSEEIYEYGAMPVVPEVKDYEEADKIYTFLGWDAEVSTVTGEATYTAVFEEAVQNYTIAFADEDGTILEEVTVAPGEVPVWTVTPSKEATAQYTYTFIGWDKEVVAATGSETYTAVYEATVNKYTVTWMNFDGSVITTETYEYGATPEYKGDAPVYGEYTFTGWSPEVSAVEGDVTYTAQFEMSGTSIEWFDEDGDGVAETGYYYVDGAVKKGAGLVEVDGYLYWVLSTGKIALGTTRTIRANQTNGLIEAGTYYFLSNGILETAEVRLSGEIRWSEENGKQVGYYYVMNEVRKDVGLVEVWNEEAEETTWFYVLFSGKVKRNYVADGKRVNQTVKANRLNKYTGPEGLYSFYENGVMYDPLATESGIVKYDETGKPWYYVDGHIRKDAGLVYVTRGDMAGNYIFVTFSGTLKKGTQSIKEKTCNGHTEFIGTQRFDSNTGAMIIK